MEQVHIASVDKSIVNPYLNTKLKWLIGLALASFILTLGLPHVGEEGVYTIGSLEMLYNNSMLTTTLHGGVLPRPPLYNWLIMGLTKILGEQNVLLAARIITLLSTISITCGLIWFINRTFKKINLALFTSLIFLSGDLLLKRGWLAYSDPIFSAFIFFSLISLFIAINEKNNHAMLLSGIFISLAYLSKVHTAYIFYFSSAFVLFCMHKNRKYFFNPIAFLNYIIIFSVLYLWSKVGKAEGQATDLLKQIILNLEGFSILSYLWKIISYPIKVLSMFLPASFIMAYYLLKNYKNEHPWNKIKNNKNILILLGFAAINCLPYWLVPEDPQIRYIMPIYPFLAIFIGYILYNSSERYFKITLKFILLFIMAKYIIAATWFPYEYTQKRGNAKLIAEDILKVTKGKNLYCNDGSSIALRVGAEINMLIHPQKPLVRKDLPDNKFSGFVITSKPDNYPIVKAYKMGSKSKLYLLEFKKISNPLS